MVTYRQPFEGTFPITQRYGEIVEGVTYKGLPHTGIDYGCPSDTPILASADGVVKAAKNDPSGYGKYIILEHPDGKATLYAHLWYFNNLFEGKQVKQGDVIAYSDSSGNSTGPHLHFEARAVWNDAKSHRDPITFLPLMSQVSAVSNQVSVLKGAAAFDEGDTVKIVAPLGAKAFFQGFETNTYYPQGTRFQYTGQTEQRNGYTYMKVYPMTMPVWIAVNDGETQILEAS